MTRLSNGQSFSNTQSNMGYNAPAPDIYVTHNKGDKSGATLLTEKDRVFIDFGNGLNGRLMTYDTLRCLQGFIGNLLSEFDEHQKRAAALEKERKEREYQQALNAWKDSIRETSVNTTSAVEALVQGKTLRSLEDVLSNFKGGGWEEYTLDTDGQVMVSTSVNRTPHLSSHGPLSKWAKNKRWVIVPCAAPPASK